MQKDTEHDFIRENSTGGLSSLEKHVGSPSQFLSLAGVPVENKMDGYCKEKFVIFFFLAGFNWKLELAHAIHMIKKCPSAMQIVQLPQFFYLYQFQRNFTSVFISFKTSVIYTNLNYFQRQWRRKDDLQEAPLRRFIMYQDIKTPNIT